MITETMEKEKKCIFCEWEKATQKERDDCEWYNCPKCKIKCGLSSS